MAVTLKEDTMLEALKRGIEIYGFTAKVMVSLQNMDYQINLTLDNGKTVQLYEPIEGFPSEDFINKLTILRK